MDKVGEFLTRIRNAGAARHEKIDVPSSNMRLGIAKILQETGYIRSFKVARDGRQGIMRVYLKYNEKGGHAISSVDRVSRPGRRVYVSSTQIPTIRSGFGVTILSTNKGILSGEQAKAQNLGGELLCKLW
ncbi:MAG: 30S ribosomal protein S8 [Bdellovibrionales bacterium]